MDILFWASVVVVVGALAGNYLGIMGLIDAGWFWFGNQGLSYLELRRLPLCSAPSACSGSA